MTSPNFFMRVLYAFALYFKFIFNSAFAGRVMSVWEGNALPEPKPVEVKPPPEPPKPLPPPPKQKPSQTSALQLLGILQREGRLVDFLQEDISGAADGDVGAAARIVQEGCRKVLSEYVTLEPLRTEGEGATITVEKGFDATAIRLTGNVTGQPPFRGTLRHHGWRAASIRLPEPPPEPEAAIVAPAEVEL